MSTEPNGHSASVFDIEAQKKKNFESAVMAAGSAISKGLGDSDIYEKEKFERTHDIKNISAMAAGVAIRRSLSENPREMLDQKVYQLIEGIGSDAASAAVSKGIAKAPVKEPSIQEISSLAASKAIQKGIGAEVIVITEEELNRKDYLSEAAAKEAIKRGYISKVDVQYQTLDKAKSIASIAASVAIGRGVAKCDAEKSEVTKESISEIARYAASAAIQHGFAEEIKDKEVLMKVNSIAAEAAQLSIDKGIGTKPEEIPKTKEEPIEPDLPKIAHIAALAAGSAIAHGLAHDKMTEETFNNILSVSHDAAMSAVKKGIVQDESKDLTLDVLANISNMAASAAIQKKLCQEEDIKPNEELVDAVKIVASRVAGIAIQKGLVKEETSSEIFEQIGNAAEAAAAVSRKKGLVKNEAFVPTLNDLAEVSRIAAIEAIRKGYGKEKEEVNIEKEKKKDIASLAAGNAISKGLGEEEDIRQHRNLIRSISYEVAKETASAAKHKISDDIEEQIKKQRSDSDLMNEGKIRIEMATWAAGAALSKGLGKEDYGIDQEMMYKREIIAREAAAKAIFKIEESPEISLRDISKVATLAAVAAIQKGLVDEEISEDQLLQRRESIAELARRAAGYAIQRGFGNDNENIISNVQGTVLANAAANAALRRGYGRDESEVMIEPGTPPVLDEVATKEGHSIDVNEHFDEDEIVETVELLQYQENNVEDEEEDDDDNVIISPNSVNNTNVENNIVVKNEKRSIENNQPKFCGCLSFVFFKK